MSPLPSATSKCVFRVARHGQWTVRKPFWSLFHFPTPRRVDRRKTSPCPPLPRNRCPCSRRPFEELFENRFHVFKTIFFITLNVTRPFTPPLSLSFLTRNVRIHEKSAVDTISSALTRYRRATRDHVVRARPVHKRFTRRSFSLPFSV